VPHRKKWTARKAAAANLERFGVDVASTTRVQC
jgi:hypothetical protein